MLSVNKSSEYPIFLEVHSKGPDQSVKVKAFTVFTFHKETVSLVCPRFFSNPIWAMPCENVSLGICGQRRPRSACAFAQSDQGLHCPLTESLDSTECTNGEQRPA